MPNPYRLTVQWIATDAFPRCRVLIPGNPPRWEFSLLSDWPIPNVQTTSDVARAIDKIAADLPFAYSRDQLRALAAQMRKKNVPLADPMAAPWYSGGVDPYGDPALSFQCEYKGKAGSDTLMAWVAEIRVES